MQDFWKNKPGATQISIEYEQFYYSEIDCIYNCWGQGQKLTRTAQGQLTNSMLESVKPVT